MKGDMYQKVTGIVGRITRNGGDISDPAGEIEPKGGSMTDKTEKKKAPNPSHSLNGKTASRNRETFLKNGVLAVHIVNPCTTLLETTIADLQEEFRIAVLSFGPMPVKANGRTPVHFLQIGNKRDLFAADIDRALNRIPLDQTDILFIVNRENPENRDCYDLGEDLKCVVLGASEATDLLTKCSGMIAGSQLAIVDLADDEDSDPFQYVASIKALDPKLECICLSTAKKNNINMWYDYLRVKTSNKKSCLKHDL